MTVVRLPISWTSSIAMSQIVVVVVVVVTSVKEVMFSSALVS